MRPASLFLLSSVFALCAAAPSQAQQTGTISGVVTEVTAGNPVVGARISVIGTQHAATTNAEGRYTIGGVPAGSHSVQARMIGFTVLERSVAVTGGQTATVNFQVNRQVVVLGEVIAVGYGTQRRGSVTGAVDQITSQSLENRPMANLTQGLQGVIPNVNIRLLDGRPTQAPRINIRGATSIGQGGNALVLIDGVEGDPSTVNPNDVESISVLKDAASAAVYGARGAFGVLLINTKKPPRDGFSITYETRYGQRTPTVPAGYVTDGYTYAKMFNESFFNFEGTFPQNVNKTQTFSQQYLSEFEKRSKDPSLPRVSIGPDGQYVYYASEDWYGLLYKDDTPTKEHSLSVSRSTDKANFLVSGRYLDQPGLFRYSSDDYRMLNLRATGSVELYPWLQVNNSLMVSNRKYFNPLNIGEGGGIWRNLADEGHPSEPMLNEDGTLTWSGAYTVGDFYYGKNGSDLIRNSLRNTTGLTATLLDKKLKLNGDFTFQNTSDEEERRRVEIPYSRSPGVIEYLGTATNDLRNLSDKGNYLASNLYGDYQAVFADKHTVNVVLGANYEQSTFDRLDVTRNGLIFPDAENINLALGQSITTGGSYEKWAILGGFYRLNYDYGERYLLELDGRYDGSSKFPSNQRYAFFPSASFGWRPSREPFWKVSERLISDLKFRGSYGSMGNGNIAAYTFNELFNIAKSTRILNGIQPQFTGAPAVLPDGLTWETVTTSNAGVDVEMLDRRLQFTGDLYSRLTTDMYHRRDAAGDFRCHLAPRELRRHEDEGLGDVALLAGRLPRGVAPARLQRPVHARRQLVEDPQVQQSRPVPHRLLRGTERRRDLGLHHRGLLHLGRGDRRAREPEPLPLPCLRKDPGRRHQAGGSERRRCDQPREEHRSRPGRPGGHRKHQPALPVRDQPRRELPQRLRLHLLPGRGQAGLVPDARVQRLLGAVQPPLWLRAQLAPQAGDDLVGGQPELLPPALRVAALQQRRRHPAAGAVEVRHGRLLPAAEEPAGGVRAPDALRDAHRGEVHAALRHRGEPLDLVAALQVRGQHRRRERDRSLGPVREPRGQLGRRLQLSDAAQLQHRHDRHLLTWRRP
jgi:TonB-linked SusC/RagA family outer membrane protein